MKPTDEQLAAADLFRRGKPTAQTALDVIESVL